MSVVFWISVVVVMLGRLVVGLYCCRYVWYAVQTSSSCIVLVFGVAEGFLAMVGMSGGGGLRFGLLLLAIVIGGAVGSMYGGYNVFFTGLVVSPVVVAGGFCGMCVSCCSCV